MRRLKTILAALSVAAASTLSPVQAHAATNFFCDEYTGSEFLISSHYSHRSSPYQVELWFQTDLPVHVILYASGAGAVWQFDLNAHPVGGTGPTPYIVAYVVSSQPHDWSAGSYAFDTNVPNSWQSSLHYGNHCGSNFVHIN